MKAKKYVGLVMLTLLVSVEIAASRNLDLSWNASTSTNVAGYNLYYGTASGNYTSKISAGNVTAITISNLVPGVTYYFAATAYDANGNESPLSNEASFIVPGALTLTAGVNAGDPPLINFPVEPSHWYKVQASTDLQSWTTIWETGVSTSNAWVQFTDPSAGSYPSRFYRLILQ